MIRYLRQWFKNRFWIPVLPLHLILFVTTRCNFRCNHCFIEKYASNPSEDIPLEVIEQLAKDLPDMLVLMLTGGEPFMRDDLPEVVRIFSVRARPKVISIATNGYFPEKTFEAVEKILRIPEFNSQLVISLSLEGIGVDHDTNRGYQGSFEKVIHTATKLNTLSRKDSRLIIGANVTLIPGNEKEILMTLKGLKTYDLFLFLSQNMYRENKPCKADNTVDLRIYRQLSQTAHVYSRVFQMSGSKIVGNWVQLKEFYQAYIIENTCRNNTYQGICCEAGRNIGVVYPDGGVAPCELLPADWGNINLQSFTEIWNNPKNRQQSNDIRRMKCFCTHECFISASLNMQIKSMISCLLWNLKRKIV